MRPHPMPPGGSFSLGAWQSADPLLLYPHPAIWRGNGWRHLAPPRRARQSPPNFPGDGSPPRSARARRGANARRACHAAGLPQARDDRRVPRSWRCDPLPSALFSARDRFLPVNRSVRADRRRGCARSRHRAAGRRPAGCGRDSVCRPNSRPRRNAARQGTAVPVSSCRHQQPIAFVATHRFENVTISGAPGRSTRAMSRNTSAGRARYWIAAQIVAPSNSDAANGRNGLPLRSCTRHSSRNGFSASARRSMPMPTTRRYGASGARCGTHPDITSRIAPPGGSTSR